MEHIVVCNEKMLCFLQNHYCYCAFAPTVRVRTLVGHGEQEWRIVFGDEVLVVEHAPVNRLASSAIARREIASLKMEIRL